MLDKVQHFIVLMLENRSFDHMLGYLEAADSRIDGLNGDETNPVDPRLPDGTRVQVSPDARYTGDFDRTVNGKVVDVGPGHEFTDAIEQLYAPNAGPVTGAVPNQGFVANYGRQANSSAAMAPRIMKCFAPEALPVLTTLAREFALCDAWFSSVPGPTWPNRLFVHAATSDGLVVHKKKLYGMRTLYDLLKAKDLSARIYAGDIAQSLLLKRLLFSGIFRMMDAFYADARSGKLPTYSFIEPDYFGGNATDQHPPHDIAAGENLIANVYEALRASRYWNTSALIVLYDEHGGLYDHVTPGEAVNPDGKNSGDPAFDFQRLGLRVPAVVASPYIPRGTVDHTTYDHTSIIRTVRTRFGLADALTRRDSVGPTLDGLFTLATPRDDAPLKLPRPKRSAALRKPARPAPLSDLQRQLLDLADMVAAVHARARIAPIRKAAAPMKLADEESARRYVSAVYAEQTAVSDALHGEEPAPAPRPTRPRRKKTAKKKAAKKKAARKKATRKKR
jgi:phospholipase C